MRFAVGGPVATKHVTWLQGLPHVKVSFLKAVFQEYGYQSKVGA